MSFLFVIALLWCAVLLWAWICGKVDGTWETVPLDFLTGMPAAVYVIWYLAR